MKDDPLHQDDLLPLGEDLDDDALEFIATAASRSRDTLLSGMAALRSMEPDLAPEERIQAMEMMEKLGQLILAWDELLRKTDNVLTPPGWIPKPPTTH